jgi:hypothetical protein
MLHVWVTALVAAMLLSGCSAVSKKPIRMEMPTAKRHFIVLGTPTPP